MAKAVSASRFDATSIMAGDQPVEQKASPVDQARREMRWRNRSRDTLTVLTELKNDLPDVWEIAKVVGRWVWVEFPMKPSADVREKLCDMGFIWNRKRAAWQHACGVFRHHANHNPQFTYSVIDAPELDNQQEQAA